MAQEGASSERLTTHHPATGEIFTSYPISSAGEINSAIFTGKEAGKNWSALSFNQRRKILLRWSGLMLARIDEGIDLIVAENGKPASDAKLEISLACEHIGWAARKASLYLRPHRRWPGALMANMRAQVEYSPYGIVGVIGPWNYPIFTPMGSIAYALAAGNAVIFKPSEFTPGIALWVQKLLTEIEPEQKILQVVLGDGKVGSTLIHSGVDKISFTGSTSTAKKVATVCVDKMIPFLLECGGKDPVLIDKDANLARAAAESLWSGISNAGQSCIGAERIYVHYLVADRFIELLKERAAHIKAGVNYGAATRPAQIETIRRHVENALSLGTLVYGGIDSVGERFVEPIIVANVPEDSISISEETFGPVLIVNRVQDMAEAIAKANRSPYGLAASVWSKRNGEKIASQLACGMVSINSVFSFAAMGAMPFGGVKESGMGRIHGPEGLLEFTYPRTVVSPRFRLPIQFTSFQRSEFADRLILNTSKFLTRIR